MPGIKQSRQVHDNALRKKCCIKKNIAEFLHKLQHEANLFCTVSPLETPIKFKSTQAFREHGLDAEDQTRQARICVDLISKTVCIFEQRKEPILENCRNPSYHFIDHP